MEVKYTEDEAMLNRLYNTGKFTEYDEAYERMLHGGKCVEYRMLNGLRSHIVNGREPSVLEWSQPDQRGKRVPLRWRMHRYFHSDEIAMLVAELTNNK